MCGRFVQRGKPEDIDRHFRVSRIAEAAQSWEPRYNLSPTQNAFVIRALPDEPDPVFGRVLGSRPKTELTTMRWGLIPRWTKETLKISTFNARVETLDTKPAFRYAFRHNRAIIPVDGYYEWQARGSFKQPWYFHRPNNRPMAFAGLWDTWKDPTGKDIESYSSKSEGPDLIERRAT